MKGWKLVPTPPTEVMSLAGAQAMEAEGAVGFNRHDVAVGYLAMLAAAPSPPAPGKSEDALPDDVRRLVIAAREVAYSHGTDGAEMAALDKAAEAFADRVRWNDEPVQD